MAHRSAHACVSAMKVKVISILEDNYMYLVIEEQSKQAIAVDPAVPHRVRSYLVSICTKEIHLYLIENS